MSNFDPYLIFPTIFKLENDILFDFGRRVGAAGKDVYSADKSLGH